MGAGTRKRLTMATIKRIDKATRVLGAPANMNNCAALAVRDVQTPDGHMFMVSAWELSPAELQALVNGETLKLWVQGRAHPVVAISVGQIE